MPRIRYGLMGAAVAALLCLAPARGSALSLGDVDSFNSLNDQLTFSNFQVVASGSLSSLPLTSILIVPTMSGFGFELVGPISANDGEIGDLLVRFDVDAVLPIVTALLSFNGAASGAGSGASVTETFDGLSNTQLFVFATGAGGLQLSDQASIPSLDHLRVTKDILVDSSTISGGPGSAVISSITQEFVVPEPATALLVLLGLGTTLALRSRV